MASFADRLRGLTPSFALVACLAAVVAAAALWRVGSEASERTCIERAAAKYPGVPVSSTATRDRNATGPLKLSYDAERKAAVDDCG